MIRAHRVSATAQDDASLVTGWNIAPNVGYVLRLLPSSVSCGVFLYAEDGTTLLASGAALAGTEQPCVLIPQPGLIVGMVDAELGWHLLLTTVGTESQRRIRINPAVDLPDEIHPVYADDGLALARATAGVDESAHYQDDVTVSCPLGLGAGLGDVVSVPVDGVAVVGQVVSVTWTATPDGASEQAVIRRHVAIAPEPAVAPPVPPVVADDTGATPADETTSGNVLANDESGLTVVAVNGLSASVGVAVDGNNGGTFTIASTGAWTFDPDGDFALLKGSETAGTSVTYYASDGVSEAMGTLAVTVSSSDVETDPYWSNVSCLLNANEPPVVGNGSWTDASGKSTITKAGTPSTALVEPDLYHIAFKGNPDRLHVDSPDSFAFGSGDFTIEQVVVPTVDHSGVAKWAFCTMYGSGYSGSTIPQWMLYGSIQSNYLAFGWYLSSTVMDAVFASSAGVVSGVPINLCAMRRAGVVYLYKNGVLIGQKSCTRVFPYTSQGLRINYADVADGGTWGQFWQRGSLRSLRVTKGIARYEGGYVVDLSKPYFPTT